MEQRVRRWPLSSQSSRRQGPRCALWVGVLGAGLIAAGLLVLGCASDPVANYRVLAFFFDGVPVPPELVGKIPGAVIGPDGAALDRDDPLAREILANRRRQRDFATKTEEKVEVVSVHSPYMKRLCERCHDPAASYKVSVGGGTCRQCHSAHYALKPDDWTHGPVALGKCELCHLSHTSQYESLLTMSPRDQCLSCHDAERVLARTYHSEAETKPCSACHDPHSAGNRMLLVDATTYRRRKLPGLPAPTEHDAWDKKSCPTCHLREKSNLLVTDVDSRCLSCHKKVQDSAMPQRLHKPVREGKCTLCHAAHRSARPRLTKVDAEVVCLGCHKVEDLQNGVHPPMRRADCLLCHTGHSSSRKHLLNALGEASWQSRRDRAPAARAENAP